MRIDASTLIAAQAARHPQPAHAAGAPAQANAFETLSFPKAKLEIAGPKPVSVPSPAIGKTAVPTGQPMRPGSQLDIKV